MAAVQELDEAAWQAAKEAGPAVIQGHGQLVLWKQCKAYYMSPQDSDWKDMQATGQLELMSKWQVYLVGGQIRIQEK